MVGAELDTASCGSKQGVVVTAAYVYTRVEVSAALTHDNLSGLNKLAAVALNAQVLCVRVTAVAGGTQTLLVCHFLILFSAKTNRCRYRARSGDCGNLDGGQLGAVALTLTVTGLVLELEDVDLRTLLVADDFGANGYLG